MSSSTHVPRAGAHESEGMRIFRLAFGNWLSRAYLVIVAAVAIFVAIDLSTWDQADANLVAVWLIFVTMPFSFLIALVPDSMSGPVALYAVAAFAALVNATLIGGVVALTRRVLAA